MENHGVYTPNIGSRKCSFHPNLGCMKKWFKLELDSAGLALVRKPGWDRQICFTHDLHAGIQWGLTGNNSRRNVKACASLIVCHQRVARMPCWNKTLRRTHRMFHDVCNALLNPHSLMVGDLFTCYSAIFLLLVSDIEPEPRHNQQVWAWFGGGWGGNHKGTNSVGRFHVE